jgi:hypothetical protein
MHAPPGADADMKFILNHGAPRGCVILLAGLAAYLIAELYPEDPAEAVATMRPVFLGLDAPRGLSPAARLPV